jgi:hypothetical protein
MRIAEQAALRDRIGAVDRTRRRMAGGADGQALYVSDFHARSLAKRCRRTRRPDTFCCQQQLLRDNSISFFAGSIA